MQKEMQWGWENQEQIMQNESKSRMKLNQMKWTFISLTVHRIIVGWHSYSLSSHHLSYPSLQPWSLVLDQFGSSVHVVGVVIVIVVVYFVWFFYFLVFHFLFFGTTKVALHLCRSFVVHVKIHIHHKVWHQMQ